MRETLGSKPGARRRVTGAEAGASAAAANPTSEEAVGGPGAIGPFVSPASFLMPERSVLSAWSEHVPFAFWLYEALAPKTFVELGTYSGVSYLAFCQAVLRTGGKTACFAVDTWKGDDNAGFYGEEVFDELRRYHDARYAAFSSLVRSTFNEASRHFLPGSIDLLHIDGLHTFEAVREDFATWLPKLSDHAVVILHDTNVRERGYGVYRFWDDVKERYPAFEFLHGHGLGVVGVGAALPDSVRRLLQASQDQALTASIRDVYARLGAAMFAQLEFAAVRTENARLVAELSAEADRRAAPAMVEASRRVIEVDRKVADADGRIARAEQRAAEAERKTASAERTAAAAERRVLEADRCASERAARIAALEGELSRATQQLRAVTRTQEAILASKAWRVTAPLRFARNLPKRAVNTVRRVVGRTGVAAALPRGVVDKGEKVRRAVDRRIQPITAAAARAMEQVAERLDPMPEAPLPSVAVGIVTYNRPAYFREVVEAAVRVFGPIADLFVYNDGSSPNEEYRQIFAGLPASVTVFDAPENRGVAHGKNALLRAMRDYDYLFLLEDDIVPLSPEAITEYIRVARRTGHEHLSFAHHGPANASGPVGVDAWVEYYPNAVGAWCMYTQNAIATVGTFDEGFHNAWEHMEHTHRLAKAGLTSQFWRFADVRGSRQWFREIPGTLETSTIRQDPNWLGRMIGGLEYWKSKDADFPLAHQLAVLQNKEKQRARPAPAARSRPASRPRRSLSERLRIAVIVPAFNGKRFLREAIDSVRAQTLPPAELIVVDDGSTDDSLSVLAGWEAPFPVTPLRQANAGQSAARNRGAKETTCEYLAFLDQDDRWHPNHLEELAERFREAPDLGWVYCNVDEINEAGHKVQAGMLDNLLIRHPLTDLTKMLAGNMHILPSASLVRREAFFAVGGFDERLSGYEDDDLFLRLFVRGFDSAYIPEPSLDWRVYSTSSAHSERMTRSERIYAQKLIDEFPGDLVRKHVAPRFLNCARIRYEEALARRDFIACKDAAADVERYFPYVAPPLRSQLDLELMRRPRADLVVRRVLRRQLRPSWPLT
ncbi:MAG: glycosyltransferase [Deltaproteobacteria bacterium]|nr:glycosyltransferase [Deltaproteobacteria bacterium]